MAPFASIPPTTLMRQIATPQAPVIIDVCIDEDVAEDPFLVPTARRHPHIHIGDLVPELTGRRVVVVCQKGHKLSHGAAALLRTHQIEAVVLDGGNAAWRAVGLPRIPVSQLPGDASGSLWVTGTGPDVTRTASAWLIRRFVDPQARFLHVPAAEAADVAVKFAAMAFDIAGVAQHDSCRFGTMIDRFGLRTAALDRVARVVRATAADRDGSMPEAAGLLALSVGLARGFQTDLALLEASLVLYDALYLWARDGHDDTTDQHAEVA